MSYTDIDGEQVWYCDSCGLTERDPSGDVWWYVSLCEHVMSGDDEDEDGNSITWFDQSRKLHACGDDECSITELCGDCQSNLRFDMPRADGPVLPAPVVPGAADHTSTDDSGETS